MVYAVIDTNISALKIKTASSEIGNSAAFKRVIVCLTLLFKLNAVMFLAD